MVVQDFLKRWALHYINDDFLKIPTENYITYTGKDFFLNFSLTDSPVDEATHCIVSFYIQNLKNGKWIYFKPDATYKPPQSLPTDIKNTIRTDMCIEYIPLFETDFSGRQASEWDSNWKDYVPKILPSVNSAIYSCHLQLPQGSYKFFEYSCDGGYLYKEILKLVVDSEEPTTLIDIPHKAFYYEYSLSDNNEFIEKDLTGEEILQNKDINISIEEHHQRDIINPSSYIYNSTCTTSKFSYQLQIPKIIERPYDFDAQEPSSDTIETSLVSDLEPHQKMVIDKKHEGIITDTYMIQYDAYKWPNQPYQNIYGGAVLTDRDGTQQWIMTSTFMHRIADHPDPNDGHYEGIILQSSAGTSTVTSTEKSLPMFSSLATTFQYDIFKTNKKMFNVQQDLYAIEGFHVDTFFKENHTVENTNESSDAILFIDNNTIKADVDPIYNGNKFYQLDRYFPENIRDISYYRDVIDETEDQHYEKGKSYSYEYFYYHYGAPYSYGIELRWHYSDALKGHLERIVTQIINLQHKEQRVEYGFTPSRLTDVYNRYHRGNRELTDWASLQDENSGYDQYEDVYMSSGQQTESGDKIYTRIHTYFQTTEGQAHMEGSVQPNNTQWLSLDQIFLSKKKALGLRWEKNTNLITHEVTYNVKAQPSGLPVDDSTSYNIKTEILGWTFEEESKKFFDVELNNMSLTNSIIYNGNKITYTESTLSDSPNPAYQIPTERRSAGYHWDGHVYDTFLENGWSSQQSINYAIYAINLARDNTPRFEINYDTTPYYTTSTSSLLDVTGYFKDYLYSAICLYGYIYSYLYTMTLQDEEYQKNYGEEQELVLFKTNNNTLIYFSRKMGQIEKGRQTLEEYRAYLNYNVIPYVKTPNYYSGQDTSKRNEFKTYVFLGEKRKNYPKSTKHQVDRKNI